MSTIHKHIEYSKINHYIYVGTNFCCKVHFSGKLLKEKIEADISLEENHLDSPFGVKYYLWLPVKDHRAPTRIQFFIGVSMIHYLIGARKKIYVHCKNGHGRAPTLIAAYLLTQGMSVKETLTFLKSKRAGVDIRPAQINALKKFKRLYQKLNK